MFSKDDQGSLLCCQLCDESRVESKVPDVSFVAGVEEEGPVAPQPVLIWRQRRRNQRPDPDVLRLRSASSPAIR